MSTSSDQQLVFLIGYRGTGKSTVARLLANRLGWSWVDTDTEIERRAGKSIREIFVSGGESAFRDHEATVVEDVSKLGRAVVALGGGAVLRDANRKAIQNGVVIWLTADPPTISLRVSSDSTTSERRPNLTISGGLAEIEQLLAVRVPRYRECADCVVDTVGKAPDQVADEIVCFLQLH